MTTKNQIIKSVYYENFGSKAKTLEEAKKLHPNAGIKKDDVDEWFRTNGVVLPKKNLRGFNSFVAQEPLHVFEIDLFHYKYGQEDDNFEKEKKKPEPNAILCIDAFSKQVIVLALKSKTADSWRESFDIFIKKLGKPKMIMTDPDASITSNTLDWWFKKEDIKHVLTRSHATMAERAIRTFKMEMDRRIEVEVKPWTAYLETVLNVINKKNVHRTTGFTPDEAVKPENEFEVRNNLILHSRRDRKYPEIKVGDIVRAFRKRKPGEKERHGFWKEGTTKVTRITESHGQKFYKVEGEGREFIRGELLFVRRPAVANEAPPPPPPPQPAAPYVSYNERRIVERNEKRLQKEAKAEAAAKAKAEIAEAKAKAKADIARAKAKAKEPAKTNIDERSAFAQRIRQRAQARDQVGGSSGSGIPRDESGRPIARLDWRGRPIYSD